MFRGRAGSGDRHENPRIGRKRLSGCTNETTCAAHKSKVPAKNVGFLTVCAAAHYRTATKLTISGFPTAVPLRSAHLHRRDPNRLHALHRFIDSIQPVKPASRHIFGAHTYHHIGGHSGGRLPRQWL